MPTETQKNFKKQMAKLQKQINSKSDEKIFSYIENDHIHNYYSPKKSRRVRNFSIMGILMFMLSMYGLYTRVKSTLDVQNPNSLNYRISSMEKAAGFSGISSREIYEYLEKVNPFEVEVSSYLTDISSNFNNYMNTNRELLLSSLSSYKKRTEGISSDIIKIEPPYELLEYHKKLFEKINSIFNYFEVCERAAKNQNAEDINFKISNINLSQKLLTAELLKVFDKNGIKYEKTEEGIRYWYQN